jgi:tRNA dimethylallyltransferase
LMKPRLIFLVGPTASGKTAVSIVLAKRLNAEIISCDSMQVYKGMDILTSKPSGQMRAKVRHHLVDFVPQGSEYNVSQYRQDALKKIKSILKKKRLPLFVGGTGLYMTVLVDGIFEMATEDEKVRALLYKDIDRFGSRFLHEKLAIFDPAAAQKIHPNDARRIVRALEVFEVTGKPITELQKNRKGLGADFDVKMFCLDVKRDELYRRINSRVERMFRRGLVEEIRKLGKRKLSRTASAAIGIKEVREYLAGSMSLEEAMERLKQNTRNYARRQLTWFRKDKRICWVAVNEKDSAAMIASKIEKRLS